MAKLKLTVNETKTRVCQAAGREVRFSGVHVWSLLLAEDGAGLSGHGSVEEAGACASVRRSATRPDGIKPCWIQEIVVARLNRMMIGWANYFCLGPVSKAYRAVERHARKRLRQWLCAKHKVAWPGDQAVSGQSSCTMCWAWSALPRGPRSFPWATP